MIRTLVFGAIAGIVGKKLYDEGKLDPYIDEAKAWFGDQTAAARAATAPDPSPNTGPRGPSAPHVAPAP